MSYLALRVPYTQTEFTAYSKQWHSALHTANEIVIILLCCTSDESEN